MQTKPPTRFDARCLRQSRIACLGCLLVGPGLANQRGPRYAVGASSAGLHGFDGFFILASGVICMP